jgi:predicted nucleotide-binding protein (sugar kinase/HSP70/actin superfamily)
MLCWLANALLRLPTDFAMRLKIVLLVLHTRSPRARLISSRRAALMCVWEKIDPQSEIAAAAIYCVKGPALSVLKMEKPICGIKAASEDYYVDLMKDYPIHFGGESKPAAASIRINGQKEFLFM